MILKEGIHNIDAATYHSDPCPQPSLSSSIGKIMLGQSPRHAYTAHSRLNPDFVPEESGTFDIGAACHRELLGKGSDIVIVNAKNFQTKAAQEARDAARAAGQIPILPHQHEDMVRMVKAARLQIENHDEAAGAFTNGLPEQCLIWQEDGFWCRCYLDWLPADRKFFDDYKTTTDASPEACVSRVYQNGYDFQAAFYRRGIRKILGVESPRFRNVFQEKDDPYGLTVASLTPAAVEMADRKVEAALNMWKWCMTENRWPGYPSRTVYIDPPGWEEKRWLEREERDEQDKANGVDVMASRVDWETAKKYQAPVE